MIPIPPTSRAMLTMPPTTLLFDLVLCHLDGFGALRLEVEP